MNPDKALEVCRRQVADILNQPDRHSSRAYELALHFDVLDQLAKFGYLPEAWWRLADYEHRRRADRMRNISLYGLCPICREPREQVRGWEEDGAPTFSIACINGHPLTL